MLRRVAGVSKNLNELFAARCVPCQSQLSNMPNTTGDNKIYMDKGADKTKEMAQKSKETFMDTCNTTNEDDAKVQKKIDNKTKIPYDNPTEKNRKKMSEKIEDEHKKPQSH